MQESRTITRKSASNLALAFVLLPKAKRDGMSALYAFCREVDDVADDESVPVEQRRATTRRLARRRPPRLRPGHSRSSPSTANCSRSSANTICRSNISTNCSTAWRWTSTSSATRTTSNWSSTAIASPRSSACLSIEIFGYPDPACRDYAVHLGKALQLTNILRDVRTDAERGRIYLPLSELARFQVTPEEILRLEYSPRFFALAQSVAERARHFYQLARQTLPADDRRSMVAAELMGSVYWRLLRKLEAAAVQRLRPKADPPEQRAKDAAHPPLLVALRLRGACRPTMGSDATAARSGRRRLIVNADDFGRFASINQAVIRAHREGILTTASLMVNEPACDEAVALARENPRLGVGLHLTLLCGHSALPPQEIPGLVNSPERIHQQPVGRRVPLFLSARLARTIARGNSRAV